MTFDTTPLERDCVILNCSRPAVDPARNKVHCAAHDPDPPRPRRDGQDPDTQEIDQEKVKAALRLDVPTWDERAGVPAEVRAGIPDRPDPAAMEPHWDGTQWVLREKQSTPTLTCPACGVALQVELRGMLE